MPVAARARPSPSASPLRKLIGLVPLHEDLQMNPTPHFKVLAVLEQVPFSDGTLDGVYCDSVFSHLY